MTISAAKLAILLFLFAVMPFSPAQDNPPSESGPQWKDVEHKAGQLWKIDRGPVIMILAVEQKLRFGTVFHVRISNIPIPGCGAVQLTTKVEHLALTEEAMSKSGLELDKANVEIPESYLDAYHKWQKEKKPAIETMPILETIRYLVSSPVICN